MERFNLFFPVARGCIGANIGSLATPFDSGWCMHASQVLGVEVFAIEDRAVG